MTEREEFRRWCIGWSGGEGDDPWTRELDRRLEAVCVEAADHPALLDGLYRAEVAAIRVREALDFIADWASQKPSATRDGFREIEEKARTALRAGFEPATSGRSDSTATVTGALPVELTQRSRADHPTPLPPDLELIDTV